MRFEWGEEKAASNEKKHGITFTEAMTVFADPLALTGYDPDHSVEEERFVTMGYAVTGRLLIVIHSDGEDDTLRIISARLATRREQKDYEDGNFP